MNDARADFHCLTLHLGEQLAVETFLTQSRKREAERAVEAYRARLAQQEPVH